MLNVMKMKLFPFISKLISIPINEDKPYNIIFMSFVMVLFLIFAHPIVSFFTNDAAIAGYAAQSLRIFGSGYIFYGIGMTMTQALNGAGDTRTPTIINFVCFWVFQIPLAYFLAKGLDLKATGAFLATPIAETIVAIVALYYFKKGKWKVVKV